MEWRERYEAFREWQQRPFEVAPLSGEEHDCPTCRTHYVGNYCPRCGQSARIGRYSFKKAFLLFLDVWGLGNRGMFRTLRDLILRPGYMIRDYLNGMQMAYFPPFKMLFLLSALSLLVTTGWNLKGENSMEDFEDGLGQAMTEQTASAPTSDEENVKAPSEDTPAVKKQTKEAEEAERVANQLFANTSHYAHLGFDYYKRYTNFFSLFFLIVMSGYLYVFFRKSPAIPGLRFSELFVALVYLFNMLTIYSIVCDFLCLPDDVELFLQLTWLMALKQLSGFGWWRTVLSVVTAFLLLLLTLGLLLFVTFIAYAVYLKQGV